MNFWISVFSLLVCIALGGLLARLKYFRFLGERKSRYESVDGFRGFLAISVFFHHFVITYYWKVGGSWEKPPEDYYQNYGKVGVAMFFMITGFLFTSKLINSKSRVDWVTLYESRFFRIFPLYVFALLATTLIVFHNTEYQINLSFMEMIHQYFLWLTFQGSTINDYSDTWKIMAGVYWTLKYEWLFYFFLPVVYFLLRNFNMSSIYVLLAVALYFNLYSTTFRYYPNSYFATEFFLLFAVGGGASHLVNKKIPVDVTRSKLSSFIALILVVFSVFYPNTLDIIHIIGMSLLFILIALGNDLFGLFRLRSTILLGEISYSIYLLHGLVLYLVFTQLAIVDVTELSPDEYSILMPVISVLIVLISSISYLFLEKTSMDIGRRYSRDRCTSMVFKNIYNAFKSFWR